MERKGEEWVDIFGTRMMRTFYGFLFWSYKLRSHCESQGDDRSIGEVGGCDNGSHSIKLEGSEEGLNNHFREQEN